VLRLATIESIEKKLYTAEAVPYDGAAIVDVGLEVDNRLSSTYFWPDGGPFRYGEHETSCEWLAGLLRLADQRPVCLFQKPFRRTLAIGCGGSLCRIEARAAPSTSHLVPGTDLLLLVAPRIAKAHPRTRSSNPSPSDSQGRPTAGTSGAFKCSRASWPPTACDCMPIRTSYSCTCSIAWCAREGLATAGRALPAVSALLFASVLVLLAPAD
jgi:hypothetical protein